MSNFMGDLLLTETPDGGDCVMRDGLITADHAFGTAFYISLFGGNKNDSGKVRNRNTWWGNTLPGISESEKIISRFQNYIMSVPMTVKNIKNAELEAAGDLKWSIDEGIADEINVSVNAKGINRIQIFIEVKKSGKTIYEADYGALWGGDGINGF